MAINRFRDYEHPSYVVRAEVETGSSGIAAWADARRGRAGVVQQGVEGTAFAKTLKARILAVAVGDSRFEDTASHKLHLYLH